MRLPEYTAVNNDKGGMKSRPTIVNWGPVGFGLNE